MGRRGRNSGADALFLDNSRANGTAGGGGGDASVAIHRSKRTSCRPRTPFGLIRPAPTETQWRFSHQAAPTVGKPFVSPVAMLSDNYSEKDTSDPDLAEDAFSGDKAQEKCSQGSNSDADNTILVYSAATSVSEADPAVGGGNHHRCLHTHCVPKASHLTEDGLRQRKMVMRNANFALAAAQLSDGAQGALIDLVSQTSSAAPAEFIDDTV